MPDIDFVIPWVDGNDPAWQEVRARYKPKAGDDDRPARYRDFDNLMYWFRGVERFAPFVRRVHFITWGHLPPWLNTGHPKLNIVRHEDYIPAQYLPTFNSHTIELLMNRIDGLAEQFVYFNDDMYLTAPTTPDYFFRDGLPRDMLIHNAMAFTKRSIWAIVGADSEIINEHFDLAVCRRKHLSKWLNPVYGKQNIRTLLLWPWKEFMFFYTRHTPNSYLKSTLDTLWRLEGETLSATCADRFRGKTNVNQYLFRYWQLAEGRFIPRSPNSMKYYKIRDGNAAPAEGIRSGRYKMICLNDNEELVDFEGEKRRLIEAFDALLPDKSSYEL